MVESRKLMHMKKKVPLSTLTYLPLIITIMAGSIDALGGESSVSKKLFGDLDGKPVTVHTLTNAAGVA